MTKNKLTDLNDHLFMALERLDNDDLKGAELESEIQRSRAVASVAGQVISNGHLLLTVAKFNDDKTDANLTLPKMLTGGE